MKSTRRREALCHSLTEEGLDAYLISGAENRRYLSGFTGSAGCLLISPKVAIIAVDFRYVEQAQLQAPQFDTLQIKGSMADWLPALASEYGIVKLGFEAQDISFATYRKLTETIHSDSSKLQLIPDEKLSNSLRAVKDEREVEILSRAAKLADDAIEYISSIIHPGMQEKEAAWEIEKFFREHGSESIPFDVIVGSGTNAAMPHARPTEKAIKEGEPIIIDIGARVDGYCSDLSRTLYLGVPDDRFNYIYGLVLRAQLTALNTIESGMSGKQADELARMVIEQDGYGEYFGHSLGHGVGLAGHEAPHLGATSTDILSNGMVFTVEPGIYLPQWGGVRIEDMAILKENRAELLTHAKK